MIVVEHDEDTIRAADYVIDIGPGAGEHGGRIVAAGTHAEISQQSRQSLTGQYLSGAAPSPSPKRRRPGNGKSLIVRDAPREQPARTSTSTFPLGGWSRVTGVSGSGKSTPGQRHPLHALSQIDSPRRRTARALTTTSTGSEPDRQGHRHRPDRPSAARRAPIPPPTPASSTPIRELFAQTARGQDPRLQGRAVSSFNVKGGRCEACQGEGIIQIEMHFLPDVYVTCEECKGKRYNRETLEIHYKGKTIADVLDMTVEEAVSFFENIPTDSPQIRHAERSRSRLHPPRPVRHHLSGGEAQRIKLATELARRSTGRTLYILDEPTTGLHFDDIKSS